MTVAARRRAPYGRVIRSPVAFLLPVLHHVAGGGYEDVRVVLHIANAEIAAVAQETAYLVGFVIMVNSPGAPGARFGGPADRAPAVLPARRGNLASMTSGRLSGRNTAQSGRLLFESVG